MTATAAGSITAGEAAAGSLEQFRTTVGIDLEALRHNARNIRRLAGDASFCAVVKADAYGHGIDLVVPALAPLVDRFAVATIDEGAAVRRCAPMHDIIVLSEFNHPQQVAKMRALRLQPVVHSLVQAAWLVDHGGSGTPCWIKVETGMHRLGIGPGDLAEAFRRLSGLDPQPPGLMSHFASADSPADPLNGRQAGRFSEATSEFRTRRSMANSAALVSRPQSRLDMVRPGLLLYGISPFTDAALAPPGFRPVMHFDARVIAVKTVPAGQRVGYGATWGAEQDRTIAIVAAGYGDGYPRRLGNRAHVVVNGRRAAVVGMVSMDSMAIDVSSCGPVRAGDRVRLWGDDPDVARIADQADTIAYELLSRLAPRVRRRALGD